MYNEVEITDLLLGDIQTSAVQGIQSFEWKIGGVYKTGLTMYRAVCAEGKTVDLESVHRFRHQVHKHRSWMSRRVFSILSQNETIPKDVVRDYNEFRTESMTLYRQMWLSFDELITSRRLGRDHIGDKILKINQLLDRQNRRDKAYILQLLGNSPVPVSSAMNRFADAA